LEKAHGHIQFIILLLHCKHKNHAHIGAKAKVGAFVGNYQAFVFFLRNSNTFLYACKQIPAFKSAYFPPKTGHHGIVEAV
jgi:hypothetical protein